MNSKPYTLCLTSTGKERDEETGYGYFGARYMDHELMTMWLSVDPKADKYPSISPYAYCAWNPMKLVDPDGKEIDVSELSEAMQMRLVKCLGTITGLSLEVKDGLLVSVGGTANTSYSKLAQRDLLEAINSKKRIGVHKSEDYNLEGDWGNFSTGEIWINTALHAGNEVYDDLTEGLGMAFLHELGHAYFGDNDPIIENNKNSFVWSIGHGEIPSPNSELDLGDAVKRVNGYRKELGMALRASYESYNYHAGDRSKWDQYEGMIAFQKDNELFYLKQR